MSSQDRKIVVKGESKTVKRKIKTIIDFQGFTFLESRFFNS